MFKRLRYLLLQVRNADDPMREQEVSCFARALRCKRQQIAVADMLSARPSPAQLEKVDVILVGGSGDYSATGAGAWLDRTLDLLREIHAQSKPAFASCWGFQAMARALGGQVIHDLPHAELGTIELTLTDEGEQDPVFGPLGKKFYAQAGHEDHVIVLPPGATLLASSARVEHQAYRCEGKPIYCTQFHPELNLGEVLRRLEAYPQYVERIAQVPFETFAVRCRETPEADLLLPRFIEHIFG